MPTHHTPTSEVEFRVRYAETDRMGRAYYGAYFAWCEVGRVELLRNIGASYAEMEERGFFLPVIEAHALYRAPAAYDEPITVTTRLVSAGHSRVEFASTVYAREDGRTIAEGLVTLACIGPDGKPKRLPAEFKERIGRSAPEPPRPGTAGE